MNRIRILGCAASVLAVTAAGAEPEQDKSQFTLFNPTPRELMRELSADRPDTTESAYTVDAGHVQLEADIVRYSYDAHNPQRERVIAESLAIAPFNFKIGLRNNWDLHLVVPTYVAERTRTQQTGQRETARGFGDFMLRSKVNLWGNDGGPSALSVMPYVKFPTASGGLGNDAFEGGIIVPVAFELPADWGMGFMTVVGINEDEDESGHHPEWLNSIVFGHDIVGKLAGYVEFVGLVNFDEGARWVGLAGLGLTYAVTEDIQLDGGVNIGVTRSADDWNPFLGLTWRF